MRKNCILLLLPLLALVPGCTAEKAAPGAPGLTVSAEGEAFYVDEPVEFRFTGNADFISFWSGENGSDYLWRSEERIYEGEGVMSFGTAFMNGAQWKNQLSDDSSRKLLTFWWSDDFDGDYTSDGIARATWHDATSFFEFASSRVDDARLLSTATPSGEVKLSDIIPSSAASPVYFAFRYHLLPFVDAASDSRSRAVVSGFTVNCVNDSLHVKDPVVTNASAGWTFVNIGYGADDENYLPESSASYIFFNSSTTNTAERWSWSVSRPYTPDYSVNMGCDHALGIKGFSDSPLTSFTHAYSNPGTYDAVFESRNVSASGKVSIKKQHITIRVFDRGGAIIDNPERKEW